MNTLPMYVKMDLQKLVVLDNLEVLPALSLNL